MDIVVCRLNKNIYLLVFVFALLFVLASTACAKVEIDDFNVNIVDDNLDVGDDLEIELVFEVSDSSDNETIDVEIEIQADGTTIYHNENYDVAFLAGETQTVTIKSGNFPGPGLDHDYWNDNLMEYDCGEFDIDVHVEGDDFMEDNYYSVDIDADADLVFEFDPEDFGLDGDVTLTVFEGYEDEVDDARVKITWIDDPEGDEEGEWDSSDEDWDDRTDNDGEVEFNLADEFGDEAVGDFQVDVYGDDYCRTSETITVTNNWIFKLNPEQPEPGESFSMCVETESGNPVTYYNLYVRGPGYSRTYPLYSDGCKTLTFNTAGTYYLSASKSLDDDPVEFSLQLLPKATTSSSTTSILVSTTSIPVSTTSIRPTTTSILRVLRVTSSKQVYNTGETAFVKVRDPAGNPVAAANVKVNPSGTSGVTDSYGGYSFTLTQPGTYNVLAEKNGYVEDIEAIEYSGAGATPAGDGGAGNSGDVEGGSAGGEDGDSKGLISRIINFFKRLFTPG